VRAGRTARGSKREERRQQDNMFSDLEISYRRPIA
jgi:hypothetical protein